MTTARKPSYEELESKLCEAQDIIGALRNHEVDAIVGGEHIAVVRLQEVEEALRQAHQQLEQRVVERTEELARVNRQLREIIENQQQAQQKLEQYTRQLRDQAELLDLAHDMIFVHDMEGRIAFWNRGAELAYGWTTEEALGQLSHGLLNTEYSEPLIRITARIIKHGWWEGELVHTTRDGRKVAVASRWALRKHPDGRPAAILEIDNDITDRKRVEQEMAEARQFAENIVNTIQEQLVVLDPHLRVISANRSFHETFGTAAGQVEGREFFSLDEGRWNTPELRTRLDGILPQDTSFEGFEMECHGADGEPKILVLSAQPIRQQTRGAEMILLVIQDITVRKWQERKIETDKEQLSSLTEELMLTEERQRRQIAQSLHDTVGQSLAFAKRELSLLRRRAPGEMDRTLEEVCEQIHDAIQQTRDLTFELSPSILYTLGLQAAIEELAQQFTDSEGFVCQVRGLEESLPLAEQVRSMLYRAIRELLVNVAKHAGARNVGIVLDRDDRNIRILVEDDGKGFDPSVLDGYSRGSGFGIFSVRERLTHIGGNLAIESTEGKGTRITIIAPLDLGQ
ncbi:MAG: hypothetical protein A2Y76_11105 [Planctomycetes bacterium RBG_13_60_9]|nr:MAG: hypothetical protein A2Y76_11105 [Planctomycetes bacterium RBG_13_60_9]